MKINSTRARWPGEARGAAAGRSGEPPRLSRRRAGSAREEGATATRLIARPGAADGGDDRRTPTSNDRSRARAKRSGVAANGGGPGAEGGRGTRSLGRLPPRVVAGRGGGGDKDGWGGGGGGGRVVGTVGGGGRIRERRRREEE